MKFRNGPSIVYYCIGCNYFSEKECPMIIITERKEKLKKINDKT